jgi:hypothetical protein
MVLSPTTKLLIYMAMCLLALGFGGTGVGPDPYFLAGNKDRTKRTSGRLRAAFAGLGCRSIVG